MKIIRKWLSKLFVMWNIGTFIKCQHPFVEGQLMKKTEQRMGFGTEQAWQTARLKAIEWLREQNIIGYVHMFSNMFGYVFS